MIEIRQCTLADLPYIYEICWKTGDNGTPLDSAFSDKFKMGHYYAAPYLHHDLGCCFAATEKGIPKGYILGSADTVNYTKWFNSQWLPSVRKLYDLESQGEYGPRETFLNECIKNDTVLHKSLYEFPAHLHINLLPELQGKGLGRKLMDTFFERCRKKGANRVHLGVSKVNTGALTFYRKMGMYPIYETESAFFLGYDLIRYSDHSEP